MWVAKSSVPQNESDYVLCFMQVPPTLPGGVIPPSSIAGTHPGAPNISVPQNVTSQPEPSPPPPPMPAINQKTVAQRQESYGSYFLVTNKKNRCFCYFPITLIFHLTQSVSSSFLIILVDLSFICEEKKLMYTLLFFFLVCSSNLNLLKRGIIFEFTKPPLC